MCSFASSTEACGDAASTRGTTAVQVENGGKRKTESGNRNVRPRTMSPQRPGLTRTEKTGSTARGWRRDPGNFRIVQRGFLWTVRCRPEPLYRTVIVKGFKDHSDSHRRQFFYIG